MTNRLKYTIAFLTVFLIRLIPFRAPNVEPLMAVVMPMSKKINGLSVFIFSFLSIFIFDLVTSGIGLWTLIAGLAYGLVGLGANYFFKNRSGWKNYALYAFVATIFYDALTGLTIGPLFFNQSLAISFFGQIPFTILHLLGNVSFAIVISPVIEKWFKRKDVSVRSFWGKEVEVELVS
jgi:energy-coupling factor transport system substrate-specific component